MAKQLLLGVLSDTHFVKKAAAINLAQRLLRGPFQEVQAIFHAGDLVDDALDGCFDAIPFYAVRGNMDSSHPDRPIKRVVNLENWRIGLIHGWGRPSEVADHVWREFSTEDLDVLIFGHSHSPWLSRVGKTLLFNPGSATDHRGRARSCSVGLVTLGDQITARHIFLPDNA
jgi:putative phosphoesterase